jgi:ABC-type antimicrobial peptide transport system permease subunit
LSNGAGFPINDLFRRKLQTGLTIATLTMSVASTLSLLLFSSRLSVGIAQKNNATLTLGLNIIFGQFITFIGVLIFVLGAVLTSFIVFLMMAQRTRDFGLIKAAGCPNALVAGYFMTELLTVTVVGCILGVVFGFLGDFVTANLVFSTYHLPNFWFAPVVFLAFFVLALVFGIQPLLKASKMSPIKALSAANYYGLTIGTRHKTLSHSALSWRLATRSLYRRQSATLRIVLLLSLVFILLTISIAGGIIASETTTSWIQETTGISTIAVAHNAMGNQYQLLLSKFSEAKTNGEFTYSDPKLAIPDTVIDHLRAMHTVSLVDPRLILMEHVHEIGNFTIDPDTSRTIPVGGNREGDSLVIGVEPQNLVGTWSVKGRFLINTGDLEAVIGDSISQTMYVPNSGKYTVLANPLLESISFQNAAFPIVGVCVDPLNNGFVIYVPLKQLENAANITSTNLLFIKIDDYADRPAAIQQIRTAIQAVDSDLNVFDYSNAVKGNSDFLVATWKTIMLLPLYTLASAALCLVGYMMLTVNEQQHEFAVLRAVGAKSRLIIVIAAIQSSILLFSSFGIGLSLGTIITLLILMINPLVTIYTIIEISLWLIGALVVMLLLSLYPAFRLSKNPILKIMTQ